MVSREGERPPCTQSTELSTTAERQRQSNTSTQYFHTSVVPYFLRLSS